MEQHEDSGTGFVPDAYDRAGLSAKAGIINPLRSRWRVPAVATTMALVAALCLHTGSAAHAASPAKAAAVTAHAVPGAAAGSSLTGHVEAAADSTTGGVHGAFNLYDGVGGGIEFWFNPSTGQLTVAVGAGIGEGGGGVLGTYAPGSAPEPGDYLYANADLSAGTIATVNVSGLYSLDNGVFVGSINTTVDGRTLTIASDGGATFDVSVVAAEGAAGFSGAVGVEYVYSFNVADVISYIWNAITDFFTSLYSLEDDDDTGDATYEYYDGTDEDTTGSDETSTTDTTGDDSTDSGGDSGDGGDGGGCSFDSTNLPDRATPTQESNTVTPAEYEDDDDSVIC